MENAIIDTLAMYDIVGGRREGATGVWLDAGHRVRARKICAIGVRVSRFVTMHGFAFNVNTDLRYFNYINPCGFDPGTVTSLQQELGREINMEEVKLLIREKFTRVF
jgi:lipoyl(octanoyl) transferase